MTAITDDARVPLLASQDSDEFEALKEDVEVRYPRKAPPMKASGGANSSHLLHHQHLEAGVASVSNGGGLRSEYAAAIMSSSGSRRKKQYSGNEMIVAVFVVAFDTKKGNIVEWKYPSEVVLEGIEFKSMASGLHKIEQDFIYFKQKQLYGLSCFEKIPVANQEERGARMKSVGLLAVGYSDLHLHKDFLQRQVRSQVESPGEYGSLEEYFRHYRNPNLKPSPSGLEGSPDIPLAPSIPQTPLIQHPVGCFSRFVRFFGPRVFTLWRLALLKKRVLLFSQPPIGQVCHRVYCTCLLPCHALPLDLDTECSPQFYVNVADIDHLQSLESYVACTTEKIFQSKTRLYDVFVDGTEFHSSSEANLPLLRNTADDQQRYEHLCNIRSNEVIGGVAKKNEEDLIFAEYFQELTSQLLRVLLEAADSEDHVLTVEMVQSVQLDPARDRLFLTQLATVLHLDLTVQQNADVFTCCL